MPSSVGTSLFAFAAILTAMSPPAAIAVAGLALAWECLLFYHAGR